MNVLCVTYASIRLGKNRIVLIFLFHCKFLGVQSQIEEYLEIEKAHQNGNSGVEGS